MDGHTTTEPLRIAQFITQYPYPDQYDDAGDYYCAGAERVAQELSEALARAGHDVHVFTSAAGRSYETNVHPVDPDGTEGQSLDAAGTHEQTPDAAGTREQSLDAADTREQRGVTVHRSPSFDSINTTQLPPTLPFDGLDGEFDVLHAHNSTPPGILSAYVRSLVDDAPFVITHHGGEQYEPHGGLLRRGGLFLYTRVLMEPVFESADAVVTPSGGYAEESRVLDSPAVSSTTIRNGVDFGTFRHDEPDAVAKEAIGADPDEFLLLFLGAHHPRKGPDVLLEAFAEFAADVENARLVLAGSGDLTPELEATAAELGIEDRVTFPGYVPEERKPTYFAAADCFVLPSNTGGAEMFPLVLLEAAAAGTPVVASDYPTLRSVVEGGDIGTLVEPGDASALAAALDELHDSDALADRASAARSMAAEHRWTDVAAEYEELYRSVIR